MKQVIDGKVYNTETAEVVAEFSNDFGVSDFRHCEETLYRTKKGRFFLAGEGGPMSRYSKSVGDMQSGGSGIIALTVTEAQEWCEQTDVETSVIEELFEIEEA